MSDLLAPRPLGPLGQLASGLGLGTARLGAFWQGRSVREAMRTLGLVLDAGVTLIDTADVYARGISERLVGRALRSRDDVLVMTKVGLLKTPVGMISARRSAWHRLGRGPDAAQCFESPYVVSAAHRCLRRQRRDALDVLLLHEPTVADLRAGAFQAAMDRLTRDGDVRAWGASVRGADAALAALDLPDLGWLQVPANIADNRVLRAIADHPRARQVPLIGLAVLGDGTLLTRARAARPDLLPADLVAALVYGAAALPGLAGVLLGMSTSVHASENLAALARGVPEAEVADLRAALAMNA
jgi:aryl-alcohol dehydrogenase-like predicted oxidoreductase